MMEKYKIENKFDKNTVRLITFDLFLLFSILSTGIIYAVFLDFMNTVSINNIEITEIQQSIIIGLVVGTFSIFYLIKVYKIVTKHFNHEGETS